MLTIENFININTIDVISFITSNPNSLIYITPNYLNLIAKHLDAVPEWLIAKQMDKIVGILPYLVKDGPLGPVYNSLAYYGSNGGVIQIDHNDDVKFKLVKEYYSIAEKNNACSSTIITNPLEKDNQFYESNISYQLRDHRIGQITHLPPNPCEDELMSIFHNPRPRNIRRAIKEGVQVEKNQSKWAIDFLYEIHKKEMEAKGGLAKNRSFFDLVPIHLDSNEWAIYIAKLNDKPIAALLLLYFNKTVEYFTPAIIYDFRNTQASTLIVYKAMLDAISIGYLNWNWGGTWSSQEGVYNYKKKWNANDYPYYYYIKYFNNELLNKTPEYLKKEYYGFYTIPYSELNTKGVNDEK